MKRYEIFVFAVCLVLSMCSCSSSRSVQSEHTGRSEVSAGVDHRDTVYVTAKADTIRELVTYTEQLHDTVRIDVGYDDAGRVSQLLLQLSLLRAGWQWEAQDVRQFQLRGSSSDMATASVSSEEGHKIREKTSRQVSGGGYASLIFLLVVVFSVYKVMKICRR